MLSKVLVKVAGMEKRGRRPYYPRPSSAGPERCIRQTVYHARGIPEDKAMADRFVMVLDDSSWHEDLTGDWLQKTAFRLHSSQMEIECAAMFFTDPPIKLIGHIDGIITDMLMKDRLWEHKALNHFTFEKYWKGAWPLDYITQCCLYILGVRKVNPDIDEAVLLIKNKNTSQFIDMVIRYDPETDTAYILEVEHSSGKIRLPAKDKTHVESFPYIVETALGIFEQVHKHAQDGTLPERPFEIGTTFPCGYCSWEETCWGGYAGEFNELRENVELPADMETTARMYLEDSMHAKNGKEGAEYTKGIIKDDMKRQGVRHGRAGRYLFNLVLMARTGYDRELLEELVDPAVLAKARKTSYSERLNIRLIKPASAGKEGK